MAASAGSDSFFARIGEYFTLSAAQAAQAKLGEPARKEMDQALSVGRQRADAAESLWSNGHTAEGLRLALRALEDTLAAAPAYARAMGAKAAPSKAKTEDGGAKDDPAQEAKAEADEKPEAGEAVAKATDDAAEAEPKDAPAAQKNAEETKSAEPEKPAEPERNAEPEKTAAPEEEQARAAEAEATSDWSSALLARGTKPANIDKIRAALEAAKKASLPTLDADVSAAHADLFQQALDARHLIDSAFGLVALPPKDLGWTRFSRIGTTASIALVVATGSYFALRTPEGVFADASDVWAQSPTFAPETIIDGNEDSYWLLPDGATGWVEARISPSVSITRIRLLNTHNPPHNDRATRDYAVEVYSGGAVVQTIEGSFEFSTHPEFVTHDIGANDVDRIRFVVRSHHNVGGGLAELQWE